MSMLNSFFAQGFKASKCKTLLKLSIPRIKLLRNRREIQLKNMRREIAKLLETGQEATARIRVEHIIREENMMAAQEILELFCELVSVRLPIIESQRECPLDLKEAISSICFAAPRCADLPELLQVQLQFATKYGKEFISAATELRPDCGVNRQLIELLSIRAPSPEKKLNLLKDIATEHELDWDPATSETEMFKKHEDLLNGPAEFFSGSKLPLPEEKHDEQLYSTHDTPKKEQFDSDSDSDMLDFPEVPKASVQPSANFATAPDMVIPPAAMPHPKVDLHPSSHSGEFADMKQEHDEPTVYRDEPHTSFDKVESKQFLPFISPPSESYYAGHSESPSESPASYGVRHSDLPPLSTAKSISPPSEPSASYTRHSDSAPSLSTAKYEAKDISLSTAKSEANLNLQDVVAAAHAAAETAERAAAAARSAASLAQLRISELTKMRSNEHTPDNSSENPFYAGGNNESTTERDHFTEQNAAVNPDGNVFKDHDDIHRDHYDSTGSHSSSFPSFDTHKEDFDSSLPADRVLDDKSNSHQPKRLPSMEDDSYFSYPNLFTSQNSNAGSHTDNSRTTYDM
ncbi:unnamed protein product [Lathyrus oleraceus]|uniref:IST1-like protein n=2 Tax=Pisum sativum TaxID=3888 RepID=A0A9D5GX02_PEA|nr:uncharacterized protein LOC127127694 isoform X1 [Pisum sativum]KAI5444049.1 hypothetical protein KIW84_012604 [Pisum sativum]